MVQLEEKRAQYLYSLTNPELSDEERSEREEAFNKEIEREQSLMLELEARLPDVDIKDPYGGNEAAYDETCSELDRLIDQLIDKLS
jgi:protein-tyrosine phosphatase